MMLEQVLDKLKQKYEIMIFIGDNAQLQNNTQYFLMDKVP